MKMQMTDMMTEGTTDLLRPQLRLAVLIIRHIRPPRAQDRRELMDICRMLTPERLSLMNTSRTCPRTTWDTSLRLLLDLRQLQTLVH